MSVVNRIIHAVVAPTLALALPFTASAQGLIRDAEIEHILREFSDPLFEVAGLKPSDVSIYIVQDNTLNAFVAGGQNLFLNTGLIMEVKTPEELKGVIAHETGHIAGGHNVTSEAAVRASSGTSLITLGLGVIAIFAGAPDAAMALFGSAGQFGMLTYFKFNRAQESAADQYGLDFLAKTHQSADGLVSFMEKFRYEEMMSEGKRDPYFRTHPISNDRIAAVRRRAAAVSLNAQPQSQQDDRPACDDEGQAGGVHRPPDPRDVALSRKRPVHSGEVRPRHRGLSRRRHQDRLEGHGGADCSDAGRPVLL